MPLDLPHWFRKQQYPFHRPMSMLRKLTLLLLLMLNITQFNEFCTLKVFEMIKDV